MNSDNMRVVSECSPTRRQVVQKITDAIVAGRFVPGSRLIERELCEQLGVSRTSVREALRELESDGLIENIPNKGPIVARIGIKQATDIYDVRAALEALATRLFTRHATDAEVDALEEAMEAVGRVYKDYSPERFIAAKNRFYDVLLSGGGNEVVRQSLRSIHVRVSQLRLLSLASPSRADRSLEELRHLVRAIRARDESAAARACVAHVENAAAAAIAVMRQKRSAA